VPSRYKIEISPTGYRSLEALKNKKTLREVAKVIDGLARAPDQQGKSLVAPLEGVRSVRVGRERFRILFRVDAPRRVVSVLLVGERASGRDADVYALARKLLETFKSKGKGT
jgi:mRNA-degrading endonuclease RelE of RelBE toxin-antitoxin system